MTSFDLALLQWLTSWHGPALDHAMAWASLVGGGGRLWLLLGVMGIATPRYRAAAWRLLLTLGVSYGLVDGALKPLIARPRPPVHVEAAGRALPPPPVSWSFPSGHAASSVGAAIAVSRMWPQARLVWWTLAAVIAHSRLYLGHHYPLDVLGGALVGSAVAFWVLGGRHPATYTRTLPRPLPPGVVVRP
ncbi:MAG: phosphatase PAP2 family protein [Acidobacteriota bacterium]